jgi:hypothetical protein
MTRASWVMRAWKRGWPVHDRESPELVARMIGVGPGRDLEMAGTTPAWRGLGALKAKPVPGRPPNAMAGHDRALAR